MYSNAAVYPRSSRTDIDDDRARYWGRAQGPVDRLLLILGAISLVGLVPMLWIWLLYGGGFGGEMVYPGAAALCGLTAGIGFAMIRILDGRR
jgi:hypothetical protein